MAAPQEGTSPHQFEPSRSGLNAAASVIAAATSVRPALRQLKNPALSTAVFIENVGQFDSKVLYQVKIGGQTAWLTTDGVVFDATRPRESTNVAATSRLGVFPDLLGTPSIAPDRPKHRLPIVERLAFTEDFLGANCCSKIEAKELREGAYNYFQESDPSRWRTNVRGYGEVVYRDVWPGVDLRIYGNGSDLEQEFLVQTGGDLSRVQISYRGIDRIDVAQDGSLEVNTAFGKLRETKPRIYQQVGGKRSTVEGEFKLLSKNSYSFEVGAHSPLYALVIDPTLLYSTFLGGSAGNNRYTQNSEVATGIAVDASGNAYVAGTTASADFPTTLGAIQTSPSGGSFITKLNATGSGLVYSTYLGVSTSIQAIAVDASGQAYVTGYTSDSYYGRVFPTTANAYYPTTAQQRCASADFFLTALNLAGNKLVYSTCFNAPADSAYGQYPKAIAVDGRGKAFIAGNSNAFVPTTANAYQVAKPGDRPAAFVMALDTTVSGTSSLFYSTYFGIPIDPTIGFDWWHYGVSGNAIALDSFGGVYIGGSAGDNLPVSNGSFQTLSAGGFCNPFAGAQVPCPDGFIAKLNPSLSGSNSLIYATYLGGPGNDNITAIAVDNSGAAYVTGYTQSSGFPVTPGAFQTTGHGYPYSTFVSKVNPGGSKLMYSTYLTDNFQSFGNGIAVDSLGNAYITGTVNSATFPVTPDAFQSTYVRACPVFS